MTIVRMANIRTLACAHRHDSLRSDAGRFGAIQSAGQHLPNSYTITARYTCMDTFDIDPDTMMVAAGIVLSLIAVLELYPAWTQARNDGHSSPLRDDDRSAAEG